MIQIVTESAAAAQRLKVIRRSAGLPHRKLFGVFFTNPRHERSPDNEDRKTVLRLRKNEGRTEEFA